MKEPRLCKSPTQKSTRATETVLSGFRTAGWIKSERFFPSRCSFLKFNGWFHGFDIAFRLIRKHHLDRMEAVRPPLLFLEQPVSHKLSHCLSALLAHHIHVPSIAGIELQSW